MIVPIFISAAADGSPLTGALPVFVFFKRRNADGSITDLPDPTITERGGGSYDFAVDDAQLPDGSEILYVVDCTVAAAQRYVEGRLGEHAPVAGVLADFFGTSISTGAPAAGLPVAITYFTRRNADASLTDLIGSAPSVVDQGGGLYAFTVASSLLPAGSQIRYTVDLGTGAAARYLNGSIDADEAVATPTDPITFGGAAWSGVLDGLRAWVRDSTGLADGHVIWADQTGPRPAGPFASLRIGPLTRFTGTDEVADLYDAGRAPGSEVELRAIGLRQFTCSVELFTSEVLDASSAHALLTRAQLALALPVIRDALKAAGVTVFSEGTVQNLSALKDVKFEGRALLEIGCYTILAASQFTTYIETVETTSYMGPPGLGTRDGIDIP